LSQSTGALAEAAQQRKGLLFAVAAYGIWGVAPIYFVWVGFAAPLEILMHRVLWSVPVLVLLITVTGQWTAARALSRREVALLFVTALCLSANWLTFIWAIQAQRIADASLGYFINPLINILLGWVFLQERLRPLQWFAVAIALLGVGIELGVRQTMPWLGLTLALTFGFYALLRKQVSVPAAIGLWVETMLMLPIALLFLFWLLAQDGMRAAGQIMQLALGGMITVVPLVCFAAAALRLPLSTLGFVQYLAPSCALLLAVVVFNESVPQMRWVTFGFIWTALVVVSAENIFNLRKQRRLLGKESV
jgi:chloramphenicol-sensitive protein RarD